VQACLERAAGIIARVAAISADMSLREQIRSGIDDYKKKINDV
jgi:hypothetical protein